MEQRYIVDVLSDAHQKAMAHNLSYKEGVIYNDIALLESKYGYCRVDTLAGFLHMSEEDLLRGTAKLIEDGLITVVKGNASIVTYSMEDFENEDDTFLQTVRCLWKVAAGQSLNENDMLKLQKDIKKF